MWDTSRINKEQTQTQPVIEIFLWKPQKLNMVTVKKDKNHLKDLLVIY